MFENIKTRRGDWLAAGALFLLLMARACAFGVEYWPQLDDYIQLHNYAAGFTFGELCKTVGVLTSRPLAAVTDYFVWTPLFEHMIVGVAIISLLYVVSIVILKRLMERYFSVGPLFMVIVALLPLGVEGTYWVSASGRVVCGLFFACLAAAAFGTWLDTGRAVWALAFGLLIVVPFGYYEQSAVLAMTLVLGMGILELPKHWKRSVLSLWALPAGGIYFAVTRVFSQEGLYANRMELMLPVTDYYWDTFLPDILNQIKTVFLQGNFYTLVKGFVRGMRLVCSGELLLWFLVAVLFSILLGWAARKLPEQGKGRGHLLLGVFVGLLLAVAPLTPFLVLANPWFSMRGAVTSFPGIALVCDLIFMALWRRIRLDDRVVAVLAATVGLVCCVAGASEIGDYRDTTLKDQSIASLTAATLSRDYPAYEKDEGIRVGILGLEASFLPNQNYFWHEHVHGCTESDWAFGGLLSYVVEEETVLPSVTPLPTHPIYRRWNAQTNRPAGFDALYYYDHNVGTLSRILLEQTGENDYRVLLEDGGELGRIWEESDGIGYFDFS